MIIESNHVQEGLHQCQTPTPFIRLRVKDGRGRMEGEGWKGKDGEEGSKVKDGGEV